MFNWTVQMMGKDVNRTVLASCSAKYRVKVALQEAKTALLNDYLS